MNWWRKFVSIANKSILYMVEAYIMSLLGFIFLWDEFVLHPIQLWAIFILLFLSRFLTRKSILTYLLLVGLLLFGILYYEFPFISWAIFLSLFAWRFSVVELREEINTQVFVTHVSFYIGLSILQLVLIFFGLPLDSNMILQSYLILFGLYVVLGIMQQLEKTPLNKNLMKSLPILMGIVILSISSVLILFYATKKTILFLYTMVKEAITYAFVYIADILYSLFLILMANVSKEKLEKIEKQWQQSKPQDEEMLLLTDPYVDQSFFWVYLERLVLFLIVLGLVLFIYKVIKKIGLPIPEQVQSAIKITEQASFQKKPKAKRFISSNEYRKLYQQLILWLIKKKKLSMDHHLTSSAVNQKITSSYPDISSEVKKITDDYQRIRYGSEAASVSEKEFKTMIKYIKTQIKAFDKQK